MSRRGLSLWTANDCLTIQNLTWCSIDVEDEQRWSIRRKTYLQTREIQESWCLTRLLTTSCGSHTKMKTGKFETVLYCYPGRTRGEWILKNGEHFFILYTKKCYKLFKIPPMQCDSGWQRIEQERTPTLDTEKPLWGHQTISIVPMRATLAIYAINKKFIQSLN